MLKNVDRKYKKSQITLFIILAIILAIIFLFLLFLKSEVQEQSSESDIKRMAKQFIESTSLKYYVTTALEETTKKGLFLLGQQGGYIFGEQGGYVDFPIPNIDNVSYLVYSQNGKIRPDTTHHSDFRAPCRKNLDNLISFNPQISQMILDVTRGCYQNYTHVMAKQYNLLTFGSYGVYNQNQNTSMKLELVKEKGNFWSGSIEGCMDFNTSRGWKCEYSLESQLEYFITKKLESYLNFSEFKGYNITKGNITTDVIITADDVEVVVDFPISLSFKGYLPITKLLKFRTIEPVRLKNIYSVIFGGSITEQFTGINILYSNTPPIRRDILDPAFDILQGDEVYPGIQTLANHIGDIKVKKESFYDENYQTFASVITINDTHSKLYGVPYIFRFAIENRKPALDYYTDAPTTFNGVYYEVHIEENDSVFFRPLAFDPDEDSLTYTYDGWKADWDDVYDKDSQTIERKMPLPNPVWSNSDSYINGCMSDNETKRCADYNTTSLDVGTHNITLHVSDGRGAFDSQLVNVIVDDKPSIRINRTNYYDDVRDDWISPEDPYFIDASETFDVFGEGHMEIRWSWNFLDELNPLPDDYMDWNLIDSDYSSLNVPYDPAYTIDDIPGYPIMSSPSYIPQMQWLNIYVRKQLGGVSASAGSKLDMDVRECLPHKSLAAPYPYNNLHTPNMQPLKNVNVYEHEPDIFLANHTCCNFDGTIISAGKPCFNLSDYGSFYDLVESPETSLPFPQVFNPALCPASLSSDECGDANDVLVRHIVFRCDGERGNTCGDDIDDPFNDNMHMLYTECPNSTEYHPSCQIARYGFDSCRFVDAGFSACFGESCAERPIEYSYPCNSRYACSNPDDPSGYNIPAGTGLLLCQATCDGRGHCDGTLGAHCKPKSDPDSFCNPDTDRYELAGPLSVCSPTPTGEGCSPNTFDDDCDGYVDDIDHSSCSFLCDPTSESFQPCGVSDLGECTYGSESCSPFGVWEGCEAVYPSIEICNGLDDDCDGSVDDNILPVCSSASSVRYCDSSSGTLVELDCSLYGPAVSCKEYNELSITSGYFSPYCHCAELNTSDSGWYTIASAKFDSLSNGYNECFW